MGDGRLARASPELAQMDSFISLFLTMIFLFPLSLLSLSLSPFSYHKMSKHQRDKVQDKSLGGEVQVLSRWLPGAGGQS